MKLYLIQRKSAGRDEYDAHIVRADSETAARSEASKTKGDEPASEWINPAKSTCTIVTIEGRTETIFSSFNAG